MLRSLSRTTNPEMGQPKASPEGVEKLWVDAFLAASWTWWRTQLTEIGLVNQCND